MYCAMSESSTVSAAVYAGLPVPPPPGNSLSWTPPSSLYCTQKSVSRISAAAANLSRAASPGVRRPLCSSGPRSAKTDELWANSPAPIVAAPAAVNPFLMNERRLIEFFKPFSNFFIGDLLLELDLEHRAAGTYRGKLARQGGFGFDDSYPD